MDYRQEALEKLKENNVSLTNMEVWIEGYVAGRKETDFIVCIQKFEAKDFEDKQFFCAGGCQESCNNDWCANKKGDIVKTYEEDRNNFVEVIEKLKRELHQQRFNNKHNLSIDQKVSDEIERLRNVNKELESDNEELRHILRTLTQEL